MSRTGWIVSAVLMALLAALFVWLMRSVEWVDVELPVPPHGEAARDRFYLAKQLTQRLGASVTTVRHLEQLPPPTGTLVLGSHRWNMFPEREPALRRWVADGGHLVVLQSAWSAEGETPAWVPMRSSVPKRRAAPAVGVAPAPAPTASAPVASASAPTVSASAPTASAAAGKRTRCGEYTEPGTGEGAYGAPRRYRVCGTPTRVLRAETTPLWTLANGDGVVAARVAYGRGDITGNAIEGSFANAPLALDDGALALAAMLQPRAGDAVWFFDEESRTRFLAMLWDHGAAAILLALAAIALLLWRGGTRFGPLLAPRPLARRSIGEQVRRTAGFIAAGGGAALHRASVRALEDEARRAIPSYGAILGARERGEAIARAGHVDAAALIAAMSLPPRPDRHRLATAIARLESARRAILPARLRPRPDPLPPDPSPP